MFWSLNILVTLGAINLAWGYSSGAPKDACADLAPHHIDSSQHEILAQTTPFPYAIDVEKSTIKSGDKVRVVISGTERAKTFEGFFVQARVGNIAVGKFDAAPNVKLVDCGNSQASGATHVSSDKKDKVVLTWNAPPGLSETVRFKVTVGQDHDIFWVGHLSTPIVVKPN